MRKLIPILLGILAIGLWIKALPSVDAASGINNGMSGVFSISLSSTPTPVATATPQSTATPAPTATVQPSPTAIYTIQACGPKTLSNTTNTLQTIATITTTTNSQGTGSFIYWAFATDGSNNFDPRYNQGGFVWDNKADTINTGLVAGINSGSGSSGNITIGAGSSGSGAVLSLTVQPVFTTIVPTLVTIRSQFIIQTGETVTCS